MSKKPSKIRVVCTLHCIYLWLCESDGAEKKGPAAPHFLVDLLLSKSAVGREEWGNWKSLPFVQRVFLWEIFYQLCRRFYTTFRAFTALKKQLLSLAPPLVSIYIFKWATILVVRTRTRLPHYYIYQPHHSQSCSATTRDGSSNENFLQQDEGRGGLFVPSYLGDESRKS